MMIKKLISILTKEEKRSLLILSLGSVVLSISETVSIGIFIPIMNLFVAPEKIHTSRFLSSLYQFFGLKDTTSFLMVLIFIAIAAFIFRSVFSAFMIYVQRSTIGRIYVRLTAEVLDTYVEKPYSFHLDNNSSALFKNVSFEVSQLTSGFLTPIVVIVSEIIVLLGIFIFLICVAPFITFLLIALFGIIMVSTYAFFKKRIKLYSFQREKYSGQMYKRALETLNAVKEIKAFNARSFFIKKFIESVRIYKNAFVNSSVVSVLPRYIFETVLISSLLLVILLSVFLDRPFSELIPIMTVFALAALRLVPSFSKVYSNINFFHYSANSLGIIYNVLNNKDCKQALASEVHGESLSPGENSIDLRNIEFCYKSASAPVFDNLSLNIPLNKVVAIVGPTGSGKSTLIDITMGLLSPSNGALYYRGSVVNQDNMLKYRKRIGYVPQHIFLMDDTIASNIAFGFSPDEIDSAQLKRVIQMSQLDPFINDLPKGVKTIVGEKGVRLSGGQRQRIAIARALYRNPEILIMDEATSALDGYTEAEVNRAIKNLYGKVTIIIIAHRLSTIEHADIIYVMDRGKIVDQGNFKELSVNSDTFKKIANQDDKNV